MNEKQKGQAVKMFSDGYTGQAIADFLGVTRNTILGFLHRRGIRRRAGTTIKRVMEAEQERILILHAEGFSIREIATKVGRGQVTVCAVVGPKKKANARIKNPHAARHLREVPREQRDLLFILDLNNFTCRWPYGEGASVRYCGSTDGTDWIKRRPYCRDHAEIAYRRDD